MSREGEPPHRRSEDFEYPENLTLYVRAQAGDAYYPAPIREAALALFRALENVPSYDISLAKERAMAEKLKQLLTVYKMGNCDFAKILTKFTEESEF